MVQVVRRPTSNPVQNPAAQVTGLVVILAVTYGASAIGAWLTASSVDGWYTAIAKPEWTPPGALIGAVWSILYGLMAVAAWFVWRRDGLRGASVPLGLYGGQLVLNVLWSAIFFGLRSPGWALAEIVVLWAAVAATLVVFWRRSPIAGMLFVPYLAWVSFAAFLNATIWAMGR